jgi:hypothetical protein
MRARARERVVARVAVHILPSLERVWDDGASDVLMIDDMAYMQWAKWPEGLQYECTSDEFLPDDRKLTFGQRRRLAELGFCRPSEESPNHFQRCYARQDLRAVAEVLARVAVEVFDFGDDDAGGEISLFDRSVDGDRWTPRYHHGR